MNGWVGYAVRTAGDDGLMLLMSFRGAAHSRGSCRGELGEGGMRARENELVPGPGARVVDVDVEERDGSGPRENLYDDGVLVACREQPTGLGANEYKICCCRRAGVGRRLHSGECEINRVVRAGAVVGAESPPADRHDPNLKVLNLVVC